MRITIPDSVLPGIGMVKVLVLLALAVTDRAVPATLNQYLLGQPVIAQTAQSSATPTPADLPPPVINVDPNSLNQSLKVLTAPLPPGSMGTGIGSLEKDPCKRALQVLWKMDPIDAKKLSFSYWELVISQRDCSPANRDAAERLWASIRAAQIAPGGAATKTKMWVKVILSTQTKIQAAITDENRSLNTADLYVTMQSPMLHPLAPGVDIEISGTITDYSFSPFAFVMEQGETSGQTVSADKLAELEKLPLGLTVSHTPEKVQARPFRRTSTDTAFMWMYRILVTATNQPVDVTEYGAFFWDKNQWVLQYSNDQPRSSADFAVRYSCPGAHLLPGRVYTSSNIYPGPANTLKAAKWRWYFIGVTPEGTRVKGEGVVEQLAELTPR